MKNYFKYAIVALFSFLGLCLILKSRVSFKDNKITYGNFLSSKEFSRENIIFFSNLNSPVLWVVGKNSSNECLLVEIKVSLSQYAKLTDSSLTQRNNFFDNFVMGKNIYPLEYKPKCQDNSSLSYEGLMKSL